ncbi:DUF429 domain-containing protein [Demequina sp. SYSU T00039]|uniref:DUF429 domain-containing protein n=1 Tax=Demequina lignilytica TaxID=3051663 RepID=A0AAW7M8L3_9MICO|nr:MULTISPECIES: DUF429 domain-containing protein [unclassified Demequina]MDN4477308.1 DUF429 domain-containing protein [Demequina sp. SYSU T00039-1]MDN4487481.1 DUF429 domain-containing protein [Demequina sp. SYSU T00039]
MTYIGLDACKTGWVAIVIDDAGYRDVFIAPSVRDADERGISEFDARIIVVDIPIGIPNSGSRAADTQARKFIAPRGPSVFPTPVRAALEAESYAAARAASLAASGKSLSAQAYAIRERILDVDGYRDRARIPILEGHPEVSFRAMRGTGIEHAKKSVAGMSLRHQLLDGEGISVPFGVESSLKGAAADDVLDAAAMAWTARRVARGEADRIPAAAGSERFSDGVDSAIWF